MMRGLMWMVVALVVLAAVTVTGFFVFTKQLAHGFSAREQPTAIEAFVAEAARNAAVPDEARNKPNPVPASAEVLQEARAHWADHCAGCHANDGSGQVPMGQQMYPPAPDMRKEGTQKKTDGELFYIIENGIRLTGMPAWGGNARHEQDSWKLVRFIRRLPSLSAEEIREMESRNPKTPDDLEEEKQEREFLSGGSLAEQPAEHHHHH